MNPLKSLRSPFISFLVNLAIADALQGVVTIPFFIYELNTHSKGLRLPSRWLHGIAWVSLLSVFLGTIIISLDRYFAITRPIEYRVTLSWQRCLKISISLWIFSIVSGFVLMVPSIKKYSFLVYNYSMLIIGIIVMVMVFTLVFKSLKKHEECFREQLRRASFDHFDIASI